MKFKVITGMMLTLLLVGMLTLAFNPTIAKVDEAESIGPVGATDVSVTETVDWWPMFRQDPRRTGYSASKAPNTNNTIWSYTTGQWVYSSPAVFDGKVYVGSDKVYCLNASTGAHIWDYTTGGYISSSPAVVDGRVYVGSLDDNVYCLNATNGAKIWNYTTGNGVESSPAVVDGKVYVGSVDANVYCLNATDGAHIWSYKTGYTVHSSPAVADGKVYVGSHDDNVYCLNATNGAKIWNYTTGLYVYSSPAVAGGKVYVGSGDRNVYCLNASTGAHIWNYTTSGDYYILYSSPAVADGKVFVGSYDYAVYAFALTHDVAVKSVVPSKTIVGQGYSMFFNITVENQGDFTETFNVTVYANTTVLDTFTNISLTIGESITLTSTWNTTDFVKGNYTIKAVADTVSGETETEDNTYTNFSVYVGILGDINCDKIVDIYDAIILAGAFGSEPDDLNWNPNADLNNDDIIDIYDAIIFAGHFGEEDC